MIKINLATRKEAGLVTGKPGKAAGGLNADINLDEIKNLPIAKVVIPLVICFGVNYGIEYYKETQMTELNDILAKLNDDTTRLQNEAAKIKTYEALKKTLDADEATIRAKLDTIKKLSSERTFLPKLLASISNTIPREVWIGDLELKETTISIKGESLGFNQISDFMKSLGDNQDLVQVTLKDTQQAASASSSKVDLLTFEIMAKRK